MSPPAPLKRNTGGFRFNTVTALRFPALTGRQSCHFLESGPLYPPQAALGPLSPRTPLKRHKGRGPRPPPLESNPRGLAGGPPPWTADKTRSALTGCAGGVPCRTASPHLGVGHSSGRKEDALCFSFRWRWMDKRKRRADALLSVCRKSPAGAGLFLIDMVEWTRVMKDTGTREKGSRSGRVRSHRPTGAEGAFAAKDRCSGGLHTAV